jgi:hypothetical protein
MSFDLSNYTTVNDRLIELFQRYPEARIQNSVPKIVVFDDREWWLVTTTIWRSPEDQLPCVASAAEPKGHTSFTKDSEMMNAETSSLGRCILLIGGIGIRPGGGMASQNEVQNRQVVSSAGPSNSAAAGLASPAQLGKIRALVKGLGRTQSYALAIGGVEKLEDLDKRQASAIIEQLLKEQPSEEEPF